MRSRLVVEFMNCKSENCWSHLRCMNGILFIDIQPCITPCYMKGIISHSNESWDNPRWSMSFQCDRQKEEPSVAMSGGRGQIQCHMIIKVV